MCVVLEILHPKSITFKTFFLNEHLANRSGLVFKKGFARILLNLRKNLSLNTLKSVLDNFVCRPSTASEFSVPCLFLISFIAPLTCLTASLSTLS